MDIYTKGEKRTTIVEMHKNEAVKYKKLLNFSVFVDKSVGTWYSIGEL